MSIEGEQMKRFFYTILILFLGVITITGCDDSTSNTLIDNNNETTDNEEQVIISDCTQESGKIVTCTGQWEWFNKKTRYDDATIYANFGDNGKLKCATVLLSFEYGIDGTTFYVDAYYDQAREYHWQGKKYPGYHWTQDEEQASKVYLDDFISYSRYELNQDLTGISKNEFESFLKSEISSEFKCK
jgi:hypothetical protein